VREALGEDITPDDLGGPKVHTQSGVVDLEAPDELDALRLALRLLSYLPDNNHSLAPFSNSFGSLDEKVEEEEVLLEKTFSNPVTGFNTPLDMRLFPATNCRPRGLFRNPTFPSPTGDHSLSLVWVDMLLDLSATIALSTPVILMFMLRARSPSSCASVISTTSPLSS
jgi:hypothetical protein